MSQRGLAESLEVDPGTLQGWEAGDHKPTGRNVERIKQFLAASGLESHPGHYLNLGSVLI